MKNIKKLFLVALLAVLSAATVWGADKKATLSITSTVTSQGNLTDDKSNTWAFTTDGDLTGNKSYIQAGTNNKQVSYIRLTTSAFSTKKIKTIQVWGTSKANTSVSAKVYIGSNLLGTSPVYTTQNASSGGTEFSVSNSNNYSGEIKIEISRASQATGAIYFNKAIITYEDAHTLTYSATNGSISGISGSTPVASGASVVEGGTVTLTATPADGYLFSGWEVSGTGATLSSTGTNPTTFTMGTANATVTANFTEDSGELSDSDLALTGSLIALNFDLYNNSTAQTVNYTTSSTGTVSIASSEYASFTIDQGNKTITVTPTKETPSAQTITVNQAADENYKAGEVSFTISISDSTPQYNVTYKANGGTGDDVVISYSEGTNVTVASNSFTRAGYKFVKWNTSADGTGQDYLPEGTISNIHADTDLYAQWEESHEVTYDFTKIDGLNDWGTTYAEHIVTYSDATVTFASADKQTSTITDRPVTKGGDVSLVLTDGSTMSKATFVCTQWGSKAQTITLHYSTDGGTSYTTTGVTSTNFTITKDGLPTGTNAVKITFDNSSNQVGIASATIEKVVTSDPKISSDNVNIEYSATAGSISYSLTNPVTGGQITASTAAEWITIGTITSEAVSFTCTANEANTERTASVTLTYTYNTNQTVTKDVTITQAAAPVIYTTIPALFEAATTTASQVLITFGSWVVSGVSYNGKNIFVTDNSGNGFVLYYDSDMSSSFSTGNIISGTAISCSLKKNNGYAQLVNVETSNLTITGGGTITTSNIAMADLSGVNTGALVSYENLTCSVNDNKYYLSDGTTTLQVYTSLYDYGTSLESGKVYNIKGIYQQYNSTKEILPRSADDITISSNPTITLNSAIEATATETEGALTVTYNDIDTSSEIDIVWYESDGVTIAAEPSWVIVDFTNENNVEYLIEENTGATRTAYFKIKASDYESNIIYSNLVTITQSAPVVDYVTLPFIWAGGVKNDLTANEGVTGFGLGSDYAAGNAPYRVKFDTTGDYIQIKTDAQPGIVSIGVKMLGGANSSTIKVQGSSNGSDFTDVEEFTTEGAVNTILTFVTTNSFAANIRYIRILFDKGSSGSNVGIGPITISPVSITATEFGGRYWATYFNSGASYKLSSGANAYRMGEDYSLYLYGDGTVIPQGKAVVIISDTENISLTKVDNAAENNETNILEGSNTSVAKSSGTYYVLGIVANKLGFYQFTGTTVPAMKAYYVVNN